MQRHATQLESLRSRLSASESAAAVAESKVDHLKESRLATREQLTACKEELRLQIATARSLGSGGRPVAMMMRGAGVNNTDEEQQLGGGRRSAALECVVNVTGDYEVC